MIHNGIIIYLSFIGVLMLMVSLLLGLEILRERRNRFEHCDHCFGLDGELCCGYARNEKHEMPCCEPTEYLGNRPVKYCQVSTNSTWIGDN